MYNDNKSYKVRFDWKNALVKLILLVLFIILLLWIIPNPKLDTFYDRVFNENIQTMKEAAKSYYTVDRLPVNVGESTSMTLEEMQNKKMVLPFVDKDNKTCSLTESYVQVTKTGDNEYVLKVQLSCGDQTDYILDTIGCYDVCPNDDCKNEEDQEDTTDKDDDVKIKEYQHKKPIKTNNTTYSCPVGYHKSGNECYKIITTDKINANISYGKDVEIVEDVILDVEKDNIEYTSPIVEKVDTTYSCPAGYEKNGEYCYIYTNIVEQPSTNTYSCPAGYTEQGSTCYKVTSATRTDATYSCPSGYSEDGSGRCYRRTSASTSSSKKYCPSGYSANGSNCVKITNAQKSSNGSWYYVSSTTTTSRLSQYETSTEKRVLTNTVYKKTCQTCYTYKYYYTYTTYRRNSSYTCSTGTLNGNKCYSYASYNYEPGKKYCSSGSLSSDGYCYSYTSKVQTGSSSVTCPSGYTYQNGYCYKYTNKITNTIPGSKTCPNGYLMGSDNKCYKKESASIEKNTIYTCPTGYNKLGDGKDMKCYKTIKGSVNKVCKNKDAVIKGDKCITTIKGSANGYTCPSGYVINNGKYCIKTKKDIKPLIKKTTTKTSYIYKWSQSKTLAGWTATGKTRLVNVK